VYIQLGERSNRLNNVRKIRRSLDITQEQLAEKLSSTRSYVSWLEKDALSNPSLARARMIANALNSTVDEVFPEVKNG
jgi:transcriptional regulator with XRE-family HTH domain